MTSMKLLSLYLLVFFPLFSPALELKELIGHSFFMMNYNDARENVGNFHIGETPETYIFRISKIGHNPSPLVRERTISWPKNQTALTLQEKAIWIFFSDSSSPGKFVVREENGFLNFELYEGRLCTTFISSLGSWDGKEQNSEAFFKNLAGNYEVLLADGEKPHISATEFKIEVARNSQKAAVYAPFCSEGSDLCDAGYYEFPYANTRVFLSKNSDDDDFYSIVVQLKTKLLHFSFEKKNTLWAFKNYQYLLEGKEISLEHQIKKVPAS